jgi:hypothetical protein
MFGGTDKQRRRRQRRARPEEDENELRRVRTTFEYGVDDDCGGGPAAVIAAVSPCAVVAHLQRQTRSQFWQLECDGREEKRTEEENRLLSTGSLVQFICAASVPT